MANTFSVVANSPTSATAIGSWTIAFAEVPFGYEVSNNYLMTEYASGGPWFEFGASAVPSLGALESTVNTTRTDMTQGTSYSFRLLQYYTLESSFGGGT